MTLARSIRQSRAVLLSLTIAASFSLSGSVVAFALNNAPTIYSDAWYIRYPDTTSMYNRGYSDAARDNASCSNSLIVLDFGQVANETANGGGQYQNYGFYDFASGYPFVADYQVVLGAEQYAFGWYNRTGTCPRLHMIIGTNNFHQCPWGNARGACSPSGAGAQFGYVVNDVQAWLNSQGMSWQITAWTGNDMETGYDCATPTRQFVDAYNVNNPSGSRMLDYGDAWIHSCWTDNDVYYVSWQQGAQWPLPEIYSQAATNRWAAVWAAHTAMTFLGPMTECQGADPLPASNCLVNGSPQNAPAQAWNQLSSAVGQTSTMPYATNIRFE